MKDELMRRISDAHDAEGGVDADADLRSLLARDPEARAYADDVRRVDAALNAMGQAYAAREPDFAALADRIEARLDEKLDEAFDPTAAPFFSDEAGISSNKARQRAAPKPEARPAAPVVDLAQRRTSKVFYWLGGLAAAAAVLLGISLGLSSFSGEGELARAPSFAEEEQMLGGNAAPAPQQAPAAEAAVEPAADQLAPSEELAAPVAMPAPPPPAVLQPPADREAVIASISGRGEATQRRLGAPMEPARRPSPQPTSPSAEPPPPSMGPVGRPAVLAALRSIEASVQRCTATQRQVARVSISVEPDGSIAGVTVMPPYAGADAQCIESAVRAAQLPASSEAYVFVHAFRPAPVAAGTLARPPNASRRARESAYEAAPPSAVDNAFRE